MAITRDFKHDLFVSYAHADDTLVDSQTGWVAYVVRQLQEALRQRLRGGDALDIFFDNRAVAANSHLPELLTAAQSSALFLAIGSPSYASREWPRLELDAFVRRVPDPSRIFMIECLPLDPGDSYPAPLDQHIRVKFWKSSGARSIPVPISPTLDAQEFSMLIQGVAFDIKEELLCVREMPVAFQTRAAVGHTYLPTAPTAATTAASEKPRTVLIAQSTDDVEEEADQLLRYLRQYSDELAVLPAGGYPQGGDAFAAAFDRDLAQADLFVQLLGRRIGRTPPDLPRGYTRFQLEAAKSSGVEIMQWRHPDLDTKAIADPDYQSILQAETVVASGLEAFKSQVLTWARKQPPKSPKVIPVAYAPTVFINADEQDMQIAKDIKRECEKHALTTFLPMTGPSSEANRKDLAENLTDCDVLLFIYGDTTQGWIRSQLRFFGKVQPQREADPKLLAICCGPPAQKPDIGVSLPNARLINCSEGWDMARIRDLLNGLVQ